ncbi:MAG: M56 family metallopeptidase [Tannerellaceae bacterium]|jgi:TonB family protein|nr:M56 family metallopeptidase [Tannerellaceae bacterium]
MSPEFAYFIKVNIALMLFYAFYRLFFYKDTFFKLRRTILLIFFGLAFLYPLMNLQEWMKDKEPITEMVYLYATALPETVVVDNTAMVWDWQKFCTGAYWMAMVLLCIRFIVQLGSIIRLMAKSKKSVVHHTSVYLLDKPSGPFSFFRLIFIHQESHSENELKEILIHEYTHVSQWHSIDVILSEMICILCWMNPFVWLLKREVRHNLEYLADNTVLTSGYDSKSYQYHLLGLAHQTNQAAANLYNNFNVSHLKNRIRMMNKKRTRSIGRTKYLLFLPLVAMLILLSNIEAVARITKDLTLPVKSENDATIALEELLVNQQKPKKVLTVVEVMPQFPGGDNELLEFIAKNVKYPAEAQAKGVQGRVNCSFVVNEDGSISDIEVVRGLDPLLDAEAVRVLGIMPKWTPGRNDGKVAAVRYTVPIIFRLSAPTDSHSKPKGDAIYDNSDPKNPVYRVVEIMPQFPGGDSELLKFISRSVKYPEDAKKEKKEGRVAVAFIVNADGKTSNYEVTRSVSPSLDAEAIRVVKQMPVWEPGKEKGKPVRVIYTVPITFRLQ